MYLHLSAAAAPAAKAEQPSADEMRTMMNATMGAMVRWTEVMIDAQLRIAEKPETAEEIAKFKRNIYYSLLKGGFTHAQAMEITVSKPMPSAVMMGK